MTGFYPHARKDYKVIRNSKKNCYEIVFEGKLHRTGISTRRDAENQAKALNFR